MYYYRALWTYPFLFCFHWFSNCLLPFCILTFFTVILFFWGTAPWVPWLFSGVLVWPVPGRRCSTAEGVRSRVCLLVPGMTGSGVRLSHSSEVIVTRRTRGRGRGRAGRSQGRQRRWYWRLRTRCPSTCTNTESESQNRESKVGVTVCSCDLYTV